MNSSMNGNNLGGMDSSGGFNLKSESLLNLKNGVGANLNLLGAGGIGNLNGNSNMQCNTNNMNQHHSSIDSQAVNTNGNNATSNGQQAPAPPTTTASTTATTTTTTGGKKKKKKAPKEKKPRPKPGEIRETKALDGSTLYCCPECQMAYPDRALIEQHVVSHAVERRFVCDICNAALKRKDHLTRHKLSHIPDRPHVCNVCKEKKFQFDFIRIDELIFVSNRHFQICMKSFKRKEQLTLHIVIHSGEKKHVCQECGKGFYRKDHLRKHLRSHIARRVKSEVSAQSQNNATTTNAQPVANNNHHGS